MSRRLDESTAAHTVVLVYDPAATLDWLTRDAHVVQEVSASADGSRAVVQRTDVGCRAHERGADGVGMPHSLGEADGPTSQARRSFRVAQDVSRDFRPALSANGGGSLHLMGWPSAPSIR
jgi:hypothetical protein